MINQCILVGLVVSTREAEDRMHLTIKTKRYEMGGAHHIDHIPVSYDKETLDVGGHITTGITVGIKGHMVMHEEGYLMIEVEKLSLIKLKGTENDA